MDQMLVLTAHNPRDFSAVSAASHSAEVSNNAKQAEPLPVICAVTVPSCAAISCSNAPISGAIAIASACRSFPRLAISAMVRPSGPAGSGQLAGPLSSRPVLSRPVSSRSASLSARAVKTRFVDHNTPGLASSTGPAGAGSRVSITSPIPRIRNGLPTRQAGTSAPISSARSNS